MTTVKDPIQTKSNTESKVLQKAIEGKTGTNYTLIQQIRIKFTNIRIISSKTNYPHPNQINPPLTKARRKWRRRADSAWQQTKQTGTFTIHVKRERMV
jgi:hypothetical protein